MPATSVSSWGEQSGARRNMLASILMPTGLLGAQARRATLNAKCAMSELGFGVSQVPMDQIYCGCCTSSTHRSRKTRASEGSRSQLNGGCPAAGESGETF